VSPRSADADAVTARAVALHALVALDKSHDERFLKDLLDDDPEGYGRLAPRDRAFCRELCYGVTRHRRTLKHIVNTRLAAKGSKQKPDVRAALLLGAYQLLFLTGVKPHAAVGETVALIANRRERGFVNAILRALSALAGDVVAAPPDGVPATRRLPLRGGAFRVLSEPVLPDWSSAHAQALGVAYSFPDGLVKRWLRTLGRERTLRILAASNEVPPLCIRIHRTRVDPGVALEALRTGGFEPEPTTASPHAFLLPPGTDADALPGFREGHLSVQDATAQEIAEFCGAERGECVVDVCAAPGGKALVFAEDVGADGRILAHDLDSVRLALVQEAFRRVGVTTPLDLRPGDVLTSANIALEHPEESPKKRVVVDAPCSNSGVLRRRVEARWRSEGLDVESLARMQLALLERAAEWVRPGDVLVYATCSIEDDENRGVAMAFIDRHRDFQVMRELRRFPGDGAGDGGYAIVMSRGQPARPR